MTHRLKFIIAKLQQSLTRRSSVLGRMPIVGLIFVLQIVLAAIYAGTVLFFPAAVSFATIHQPNSTKGYSVSYIGHRRWRRQLQIGSVATLIVMVTVNIVISTFSAGVRPAQAADCAISTDTTIDSTYISNNSCSTISITGSPTITWSGTTDLQGDGTVTVNGGGNVTFSGAVIFGSTDDMTISGNTTVKHSPGNTTGVNITARNLTIDSGSKINVNDLGCAGGAANSGNGKGPDTADSDSDGDTQECIITQSGYGDGSGNAPAGGGHGGAGGRGSDTSTGGATYDTNTAPVYLGSGGGAGFSNAGAAGGGKIRINASGNLTVNGVISANGATGSTAEFSSGGGSGGAVYVTVSGTLDGSGTITANGGNGTNGSSNDGGGGGGGRIAMYYGTLGTFTLSNITATKGTKGGTGQGNAADGSNGTTFILDRATDDGAGELTIVSGLDFTSSLDLARTDITISSGALLTCAAQTTLTISATDDITDNGSTFSCSNAITTLNLTATDTLTTTGITWTISNTSAVNISAATWTSSGTNAMTVSKAGSATDFNITNNLTLNNLTFTGVAGGTSTISSGAVTMDNAITVSLVNTDFVANVNWTGLSGLTLDANSSLSANALGCSGGASNNQNGYGPDSNGACVVTTAGYGDGSSFGAGGAGHGGAGGRASDGPTGATYGSSTAPIAFGSGGGSGWTNYGGFGGGKIRIDVTGTFTHNGVISANGQNALTNGDSNNAAGGGSGGSVYISTGTFAGTTGTIDADGANGGNGSSYDGGGGGGGRISVLYVTDSSGFLAGMTTASNVAKGVKGGTGQNNGADGSDGTLNVALMAVPSASTVSSPSNEATDQARNLTITSAAFSGDGSHTTTSWQISDDNTFSASDCSDTNIVACNMTSTNKTSIVVNSTNLTFANALASASKLGGTTTYYVRVRHSNAAGASSWSSSISFTTAANASPSTPTNSAPADAAIGQSKNPTLTASAYSDSDSDSHLNSDWFIYESSTCAGTADWSKSADSSNKTSIVVNTTNGTFADALDGRTTLKAHTTYSFKVIYRDSGNAASTASTCTSFTTTNTAPALDSNISNQTFLEDNSSTGAFDLDTYFSDVDFNDDDGYTCTASNGLSASLGTMTINGNRTVDFTLTANANGSDTVAFSCEDGGGLSTASNTVTITVTAVNDVPSFTKGANQTALEDAGAQTASAWATSISSGPSDESGQTLTFTATNDNNSLFSAQPAVAANGNLTFTPAANANGSTTVTISIADNGGTANSGDDTSDTQTFTITVTAVNDVPSFTKGSNLTVLEDASAQSTTAWATSISTGPSDESSQTNTFTVTNSDNTLFTSQPALTSSGTLSFTPASNANGSATVTVSISDSGGTANSGDDTSDTQTFTITVTAVNDTPSFTKGANQTALEDAGAQTASAWATSISSGPSDEASQTLTFTATNDNNSLFSTQPAVSSSTGNLTFTPASNANGSATVTLSIADNGGTANSGDDTSDTQTFTITVTAVNDTPSFTKGANQTVLEDASAQTASAWATSISSGPSDEASQTLTFTATNDNNSLFSTQPAVSSSTGNLTFTPASNANGSATVTLSIADNGGTANSGDDTSDTQTFTITVTAVNDTPTMATISDQTITEGDTLTINITGSDQETSPITFTVQDLQQDFTNHGITISTLLTDHADNTATFAWTPDYDTAGQYSFTITASDGTATTLQTVTITVTNANQSPVFSGTLPSVSFVPGTITTTVFDLDDYFTDPDSDLLAYTVSGAILITVTITDGAVSLSAAEAISATEDLVFTATDPTGDTATSNTVAVIVTPEEASEVDIADVSHVSGSTTGEGTITIVGTDGSTLASWKAFSVGGVIPRIIKARNQYYILTVKRRSGSSIHAYTLHGSVVSNQNISPQVHYRKLAVGNLNADTTTEELVLGTRRDSKIYFKVLSFDPKKGRFTITKRAIYNGPIKTNDYALVIVQKTVTLFTKGVPRFNWKALGH